MRIVLAVHSLVLPGGTETYVHTAARELRRLGHEVTISAEELGPMAGHLEGDGLDVVDEIGRLPEECDAILANDAISGAQLAERYPRTRLVHFAHSNLFDHQLPVLLPGVVSAVLVGSELMAERIHALALDAPVIRVRQPIDTERFAPIGAPRPRPKRALILSNYLRGPRLESLAAAWESQGVELVRVGGPTDNVVFDVVPEIAEADIVVAKARAALEGMSCGRPVYVFDEFGGDGWVTEDCYALLESNNFAGQAFPEPRGEEDLATDLADYRPQMGWVNRELVRIHHRARAHACRLVEVLRGPLPRPSDRVAPVAEVARLTRASWHAERRALATERGLSDAHDRTIRAEDAIRAAEDDVQALRRRNAHLETVLATRRVRTALAAGGLLDRLRPR